MSERTALELVKQLYPQAVANAELVLRLMGETHDRLSIDLDVTVEQYARALADTLGAFPYDGPVGNGLTKIHYQARFREMGVEHLLVLRELAKPEGNKTDG